MGDSDIVSLAAVPVSIRVRNHDHLYMKDGFLIDTGYESNLQLNRSRHVSFGVTSALPPEFSVYMMDACYGSVLSLELPCICRSRCLPSPNK